MKIESLTEKQVNLFPSIVETFIAKGLDTTPLDRTKAIKAAKLAYKCAGLEAPEKFYFYASPLEGAIEVAKLLGVKEFVSPFAGSFSVSWLSFYATFKRFGLKEETKQLEGLFACMEHCGWIWFLDEACIITEKPTLISRDNQGRLHNLTGPAIQYSNGYAQYYVNGVFVPEDLILKPKSITVKRIQSEKNAEIRRVMLEIYGINRYLKNTKSKAVERTKLGTLFHLNDGVENMAFLHLLNSTPEADGTTKEYFLPVPPETVRVKQGLAWMVGMDEADYNPEIET